MSQRVLVFLSFILLSIPACNLQAEVVTLSGVFSCDRNSQCPEGLACHGYLDVYTRYVDSRMQSAAQGIWGLCILPSDWETIGQDAILESCENGRDDDGDGNADCADPDCQTAPYCRDWGQQHCEGANPDQSCETRLGFPMVRPGQATDETSCPLGSAVVHTTTGGATFCLPRCRLVFPDLQGNMTTHDESIFSGSDAYCDAVGPPWATHAAFAGPLACQHLGMDRTSFGVDFQVDACLPRDADLVVDGPTSETCLSVCQNADCLQVSHPRRDLSAWNGSTSQVVPATGTDPSEYTRTAFYCLD
jgi:hypothetical protein